MTKHFLPSAALFCLALLCPGLTWAAPYCYDFGTAKSPVWPGFTQVTSQGGEKATWETTGKLIEGAQVIEREWGTNAHSGRNLPPTFFTELNCDGISSTVEATLTLAIPAGQYRLWLLTGHTGGAREQVWNLRANCGNSQAEVTYPGPIGQRYLLLTGEATAAGLSIRFSTASKWQLNALVAVPAAEWAQVSSELLDPIWQDCSSLPKEELAKWKKLDKTPVRAEPQWSTKQRTAGFAVFARNWTEPVWEREFPRSQEIDAPVRAFASWDEYEPLTFSIHPLRDFAQASITLTDLRNETDDILSAANLDVRYVRYLNVRPNYSMLNIYYLAPDVLMPWREPQALRQGENFRIWLTAHIPLRSAPGLYRGQAVLQLDDQQTTVDITLRVLPIILQKDQNLVFGQYYHHPYANLDRAPDDFSLRWWLHKAESEHEYMRQSGMNTITAGLRGRNVGEKWIFDFDSLQQVIDLYRKVGFNKPIPCSFSVGSLYHKYMQKDMGSHLRLVEIPPAEFFQEITLMVSTIQTEATSRQWPELLYYPIDEPSTSKTSVEFMRGIMQAIKKVPGVRTYITADPSYEPFQPLYPYVDVWCCQPFSLSKEFVLKDMLNRPGVEYWCYPNHISGENDHTPSNGARMTFGFGLWKSGFRSLIPWIYQANIGDPWNNLDGSVADFVNRFDDDGSPIPVALWVGQQEGIDDGRYINTLEKLIARAKAEGHLLAAEAAQADLQLIDDNILVQAKYKDQDLWQPDTFTAYRWLLASQILRLQSLFQ